MDKLPKKSSSLLAALAALWVCECSILSPPSEKPTVHVTGMWEGTSRSWCGAFGCNGVNRISLSMIANEADIIGSYRCAIGNRICPRMNDIGRIATGHISGQTVQLRVMLPDGSSCIYNGTFSDTRGGGTYVCQNGAAILEGGRWFVDRITPVAAPTGTADAPVPDQTQ